VTKHWNSFFYSKKEKTYLITCTSEILPLCSVKEEEEEEEETRFFFLYSCTSESKI